MKFTVQDTKLFNQLFVEDYGLGYILDFTDRTMREFFEELLIDIDDDLYKDDGTSKAKRLRCFIKKSDRDTVLMVLDKLWEYRKIIKKNPITPEDETSYLDLINNLKNVDILSSTGIVPLTIKTTTAPDYQYFLNEIEKMKKMQPQERGYRLESWLHELFSAFRLAPNSGYKTVGEQIDGSFILHNETYLVEAKWHNQKTAAPDLHVFQSKIDNKAAWTRGLFISWQGFSTEANTAWGVNKKIICITGSDLINMLTNNISLIDFLDRKKHHAAKKGEYFASIKELYPNIEFK